MSPLLRQYARRWASCLGIVLLLIGWLPAAAQLRNDTFNPLPDSHMAPFRTDSQTFWRYEAAQREGRHGGPFVAAGGLHAPAASLTSPAFATEAFVPERVLQSSTAITYAASANDVCWTILSSQNTALVGWTRVGSTAYYYLCEGDTTPTQPLLPAHSVWLMQLSILGNTLAVVTDLRLPASYVFGRVFAVTDPLYGAIPNDNVDDSAAFQSAFTASRGRPVYIPEGVFIIGTTVTYAPDGTPAYNQAPNIFGDGMWRSIIDNQVANGPAFDILTSGVNTSISNATFSMAGHLHDFAILSTTHPVVSDGIRLKSLYNTVIERVRIQGVTGDALHIKWAHADADGPVFLQINNNYLVSSGGMGIHFDTPFGQPVVENSLVEIRNNFIFFNLGGGIELRGLIAEIVNNAISYNENFGGVRIHLAGAGSGSSRMTYMRGNSLEHNAPWAIDVESLALGIFEMNECLVNTLVGTTGVGCFRIGGNADGAVVNTNWRYNFIRVYPAFTPWHAYDIYPQAINTVIEGTRWDLYDAAGQVRFRDAGLYTRINDPNNAGLMEDYPYGQATNITTLNAATPSYTPDATRYGAHYLTLTDVMGYTIANPTINPGHNGQLLLFDILNSSGGAVAVTFGNQYQPVTILARPLNGKHATLLFARQGTDWSLVGEVGALVLTSSASIDFGVLAAQTCETAGIVIPGTADGDVVTLGLPNALAAADGATGFTVWNGWVDTPGNVRIRRCNISGGASANPAAATINVRVQKP